MDPVQDAKSPLPPDERYRMAMEHSLDGIAILDSSGRFVEVNPAAKRILWGEDSGSIEGTSFFGLFSEESSNRLPKIFGALLEQSHLTGEHTLDLADGRPLVVDVAASALGGGEGERSKVHRTSETRPRSRTAGD